MIVSSDFMAVQCGDTGFASPVIMPACGHKNVTDCLKFPASCRKFLKLHATCGKFFSSICEFYCFHNPCVGSRRLPSASDESAHSGEIFGLDDFTELLPLVGGGIFGLAAYGNIQSALVRIVKRIV